MDFENLFNTQKWLPLFSINEKVYLNLIRLFYCNMNSISSFFKEKVIIIGFNVLNACIGIPNFGAHVYYPHSCNPLLLITHQHAISFLCSNTDKLKANKLIHGALGQKWAQLH